MAFGSPATGSGLPHPKVKYIDYFLKLLAAASILYLKINDMFIFHCCLTSG